MIIGGEFSTTSSSYADTGLTLSITPASTSSKILQLYNISGRTKYTTQVVMRQEFKGKFRDSTEIFATNLDFMRCKRLTGSTNQSYTNGLFSDGFR